MTCLRSLAKTLTIAASLLAAGSWAAPSVAASAEAKATAGEDLWRELPVVAVWRQSGGGMIEVPSTPQRRPVPTNPNHGLRFAVWADGRIAYAQDPKNWNSPLLIGQLAPVAFEALLAEVKATGVLDLTGTCYLVPDAPVLATLVRIGGREQILYWDEVEAPRYGINIDPQPHHLVFKKTWSRVTAIVLARLPSQGKGKPLHASFEAPRAWYIKEAIESL